MQDPTRIKQQNYSGIFGWPQENEFLLILFFFIVKAIFLFG
jgi:hypothetical protein